MHTHETATNSAKLLVIRPGTLRDQFFETFIPIVQIASNILNLPRKSTLGSGPDHMKKYVRGYRQRAREYEPKWPFELAENVDVEFCKEPEWKIPIRELAESERSILQNLGVHDGPDSGIMKWPTSAVCFGPALGPSELLVWTERELRTGAGVELESQGGALRADSFESMSLGRVRSLAWRGSLAFIGAWFGRQFATPCLRHGRRRTVHI